jgi:hypothetical protein
MNYLELARQLRQECGVSGTGPTTTQGQVGEAKRLVDWINSAYMEIQGMSDDYGFLRADFSFDIVAGVKDYTVSGGPGVGAGIQDLRYWHRDTLRIYDTAIGIDDEQFLIEWGYEVFRNTYRFQNQAPSKPTVFAINPRGKALMFGPEPDKTYTVYGEYQRIPQPLVNDVDEPLLPAHLHMLIVYKAMEYYGLYEAASEVLARGERMFKSLKSQLDREQLPMVTLGDPLA